MLYPATVVDRYQPQPTKIPALGGDSALERKPAILTVEVELGYSSFEPQRIRLPEPAGRTLHAGAKVQVQVRGPEGLRDGRGGQVSLVV